MHTHTQLCSKYVACKPLNLDFFQRVYIKFSPVLLPQMKHKQAIGCCCCCLLSSKLFSLSHFLTFSLSHCFPLFQTTNSKIARTASYCKLSPASLVKQHDEVLTLKTFLSLLLLSFTRASFLPSYCQFCNRISNKVTL